MCRNRYENIRRISFWQIYKFSDDAIELWQSMNEARTTLSNERKKQNMENNIIEIDLL